MFVGDSLRSTTMLYGMVGSAFLIVTSADAADLFTKAPLATNAPPLGAVDGLNGKIEGFGGTLANQSIFGSKGALSIPLSGPYGLQVDGAVGSFDHRGFGNVAGHLFWRDPARGLIGLYTSHTWWNQLGGIYVGQVAGEGEYYWGKWTLQGVGGVEFGNSSSNTITTNALVPPVGGPGSPPGLATATAFTQGFDVKTRFFDQINLKYYLTDNWDAYVGHRFLGGKNALALGTEYALPFGNGRMVSGFVEGRVGEGDFHGVWAGLRFYFGKQDKPLMARHRQDDPNFWNIETLFSAAAAVSRSLTSTSQAVCTPPQTLQPNGTCETIF